MTDSVPFLDLATQHAALETELRAAFDRVLSSGAFILGPEVNAFEEEVARYLGVAHAVGVSSGTDALLVALMALGVGPGDEVITTPFTFFATAGVVHRLGARPVFVDIRPGTFELDPAAVAAARTERTKAVIGVDLFGQPCDLDALREAAGPAVLVEDAAQSFGASYRGKTIGGHVPAVCFSFFPAKNLGGLGDGGLVSTDDAELATRMRRVRVHGAHPKYFHAMVGGNFRLDALQAAFLRVKLPHVDTWIAARRANAAYYDERLGAAGLAPERLGLPERADPGHTYNQYVIRTNRRDALRDALAEAGVPTAIYYPKPLHLQECFAYLGYEPGSLPIAERACDEVLAIPVGPELTEANRDRVATAILTTLT
ncbi:MAG: transcriptional regulator [Sandaracinus sp.]|nr:transcriptional regulator [Sandaracinus sp.]|tara:strand:- start:690 stop:1802 length:1113 start_codon:yes stop_codon:yes gene_type:complete